MSEYKVEFFQLQTEIGKGIMVNKINDLEKVVLKYSAHIVSCPFSSEEIRYLAGKCILRAGTKF